MILRHTRDGRVGEKATTATAQHGYNQVINELYGPRGHLRGHNGYNSADPRTNVTSVKAWIGRLIEENLKLETKFDELLEEDAALKALKNRLLVSKASKSQVTADKAARNRAMEAVEVSYGIRPPVDLPVTPTVARAADTVGDQVDDHPQIDDDIGNSNSNPINVDENRLQMAHASARLESRKRRANSSIGNGRVANRVAVDPVNALSIASDRFTSWMDIMMTTNGKENGAHFDGPNLEDLDPEQKKELNKLKIASCFLEKVNPELVPSPAKRLFGDQTTNFMENLFNKKA